MHIVYVWNSKLQMQRGIINELLEPFKKKKNKQITKSQNDSDATQQACVHFVKDSDG